MNIWLIADQHFYHNNILMWRDDKARRKFPSVDKMNKTMINNHNEIVRAGDITYHLGDFSFAKGWQDTRHILEKLNGGHVLIFGNHDLFRHWEYLEMGFESVHSSLELGDFTLVHDPAVAGVLTHKNYIHGHTHGLGKRLAPNTYSVSVEMTDYYPVNLQTIIEEW